jgi:hypothetical protein
MVSTKPAAAQPADRVLNCLSLEELLHHLNKRKKVWRHAA